uniref:Uncharacterized protein n=1 Tax=Mus spicilegus TaxID=10103 RepID=A0A8C6GI30_MUSSI
MGTNKCASQVGMTAPGTWRYIYDTKLDTDKCDNSSMPLQMDYMLGANQSGQIFGLGQQIYNPKYCPQGSAADGAPDGDEGQGEVPEYLATARRKPVTEHPGVQAPALHQQPCVGFGVFTVFCVLKLVICLYLSLS